MKVKGKVLQAKHEQRELVSKTDGVKKIHQIYHVLLLSVDGSDTEVLNCESWNPSNFVLPEVGKDWVSPSIRSINFDGPVGSVHF